MEKHALFAVFLTVFIVKSQAEDCILFKATYSDVKEKGDSAYINVGPLNIGGELHMSMDLLPSPVNHNGILFSATSSNFQYTTWGSDATPLQAVVLEFSYSSLLLSVKPLHMARMQTAQLYRTYPVPYDIADGQWHHVSMYRTGHEWTVTLDEKHATETLTNSTHDILMKNQAAYMGSKPGYNTFQFQGIMKNIYVNGDLVDLSSLPLHGMTEVRPCQDKMTQAFKKNLGHW